VLLDPELHDLRPVADPAQVTVDPADHVLAAVAQLAAHGVEADRCAPIKRLEPSGTIGVTEESMPNLPGLPAHPFGDPIKEPTGLAEGRLFPAGERREQEPPAALKPRPEYPSAQDLLELRPQGRYAPGGLGLKPTPIVRSKGDRSPIKTHILEFEAEDLSVSAAGE